MDSARVLFDGFAAAIWTRIVTGPKPAASYRLELFFAQLEGVRLGKGNDLIGSLARIKLCLLLWGKVPVFHVDSP